MKTIAFLALGLLALAPAARAQVSVTVGGGDDYWRHPGQHEDWATRDRFRDQAQRGAEWEHGHCVRDWQNHEFCRR